MSLTAVAVASVLKRALLHMRTSLLALLALGALLLSVLAMHSAANAHVMGIPLPVSSSHSGEHELAAAHSGMTPAGHSASIARAAMAAPMIGAAMADDELSDGSNAAALALAEAIVSSQSAEIAVINDLLAAE